MATETIKKPYEFLARWDEDGNFQGAHAILIECTVVDGVVIARQIGQALTPEQAAALGFPFPAVLDQLLTDTLVENDQLKAQVAEMEREKAATAEAHAAEVAAKDANLQALLAEVDALRADADTLQAALTEAERAANAGFFTKLAGLFAR